MECSKLTNNFSGKVLINIVLAAGMLMFARCKEVSTDIVPETTISAKALQTIAATAPSSAKGYALENSLPAGYKKDGSVDYTDYVQKAIKANSIVVFPAFPILINDKGLSIKSNKVLTFLKGSEIRMKASSKENFASFNIDSATNVTLNFPIVVGDRYIHKGGLGQWGHGISINGSSNIVINSATITNCWGDGIYIGNYKSVVSKNITINDATCKYNRRDGMSIISVDGLNVIGGYYGFSNGTTPFCGINMEPNNSADELNNIKISGITTEGNPGFGIQVNFKRLFGSVSKKIKLDVINHVDINSHTAFKGSCYLDYKKGKETVSGPVNILNASWHKNIAKSPIYTTMYNNDIKITITKPWVRNLSGAVLNEPSMKTMFAGKSGINKEANYSITF